MDVWPEDVKRYGPSAAIVLSDLRAIGATSSEPVLVMHTQIGARVGMDRRAVDTALKRLQRQRRVRIRRDRLLRHAVVRLTPCDAVEAQDGATMRGNPTQVGQGSIAHPTTTKGDHTVLRLDSVRALLDAVG